MNWMKNDAEVYQVHNIEALQHIETGITSFQSFTALTRQRITRIEAHFQEDGQGSHCVQKIPKASLRNASAGKLNRKFCCKGTMRLCGIVKVKSRASYYDAYNMSMVALHIAEHSTYSSNPLFDLSLNLLAVLLHEQHMTISLDPHLRQLKVLRLLTATLLQIPHGAVVVDGMV